MNQFCVLLGCDYSGKSSVLSQDLPGWKVVSYDEQHVPAGYEFIHDLRHHLKETVLPRAEQLGADVVATYLHLFQCYLRDVALRDRAQSPVLMDSYYFKWRAKARMKGLGEHPLIQQWADFPPPDRILFLYCDPSVLAQRTLGLRNLNMSEQERGESSLEGFARFQGKLQEALLKELRDEPVCLIDTTYLSKDRVRERVMNALSVRT